MHTQLQRKYFRLNTLLGHKQQHLCENTSENASETHMNLHGMATACPSSIKTHLFKFEQNNFLKSQHCLYFVRAYKQLQYTFQLVCDSEFVILPKKAFCLQNIISSHDRKILYQNINLIGQGTYFSHRIINKLLRINRKCDLFGLDLKYGVTEYIKSTDTKDIKTLKATLPNINTNCRGD